MKGINKMKKKISLLCAMVMVAMSILNIFVHVSFNQSSNLKTKLGKSTLPITGVELVREAVNLGKLNWGYDCSGMVQQVIRNVTQNPGFSAPRASNWSASLPIRYNGTTYYPQVIVPTTTKAPQQTWYDAIGANINNLQMGDIIVGSDHVLMYLGYFETQAQLVEALNSYGIDVSGVKINNGYGQVYGNYWTIEGNVNSGRGNLGPNTNWRGSRLNIPFISNYAWRDGSNELAGQSRNMNPITVYRITTNATGSYGLRLAKKDARDVDGACLPNTGFTIKQIVNYDSYNNYEGQYIYRDKNNGEGGTSETLRTYYTYSNTADADYVTGNVEINNVSKNDYYIIEETEAPNNYLLPEVNPTFGIVVHKAVVGSNYVVESVDVVDNSTGISYATANRGSSADIIVNNENRGKISVSEESEITFMISDDRIITGDYSLNIVKESSEDGSKLAGAELDIKQYLGNGESHTGSTNDENGVSNYIIKNGSRVKIARTKSDVAPLYWVSSPDIANGALPDVKITSDDVNTFDRYTFVETKAPEGYAIKDNGTFTLKVYKGLNQDETEYEINKIVVGVNDVDLSGDLAATSENQIVKIKNDGQGYSITTDEDYVMAFEYNTNTITAIYKDDRIVDQGEYSLKLEKYGIDASGNFVEDNANRLGGVSFDVEGTVDGENANLATPVVTSASDSTVIMPTTAIRTELADTFRFTETDIGQNADHYIGTDKTIVLTVNKKATVNGAVRTYAVSGISLSIEGIDNNEYFNVTNDCIELVNGTIIKAEFDATTNTVRLIVVNPRKTAEGEYSIKLVKEGTDGKTISGVEFSVSALINGAQAQINNPVVSTSIPSTIIGNIQIDPNTYETPDVITITETDIGAANADKYELGIDDTLTVTIEKERVAGATQDTYQVKSAKLENVPGLVSHGRYLCKADSVEEISRETPKVTAYYKDGVVVIRYANPLIKKGEYDFKVTKTDVSGEIIEDEHTQFQIVAYSGYTENDGKVTFDRSNAVELSQEVNGTVQTVNQVIFDAQTGVVEGLENLVINKEDVGKTIYFVVTETQAPDEYTEIDYQIVIPVTFSETDTELVATKGEAFAVAADGTKMTLQDAGSAENGVASTDQVDVTINVNVPDKHKEGKFNFRAVKKDENDEILTGASFKVKIQNLDTNEYVLDRSNRPIDGTRTRNVNAEGSIQYLGLNIDKEGITYRVTIEEVNVPTGYLKANDIVFTVQSKWNGRNYVLDENTLVLENQADEVTINPDEIYVEVLNTPEPKIHKGVKTIMNQDSGYNKDELHDWVIRANVPAGIDTYTKYVITDTIDERLVFQGTDSVAVSIVDGDRLVAGTDYKVSYDANTRLLKISFIEDEFVKGRELTEDSVIEIRFNTKFALDNDGNVIALYEAVENQATLTYDNGTGEDSKVSEKPEVHTGRLVIRKYDEDTKKAVAGAKFKIATSENNARIGQFVKDANGDDLVAEADENGNAVFEGIQFGEDAKDSNANHRRDSITGAIVYKYDWKQVQTIYYIVETEPAPGYMPTDEIIPAAVFAQGEVADKTIYVDVANYQIPTAEVHKGVKDVQNQNSGYNKDDVHDWVINSTVPAGIASYTKYVITDTIDERLVFQGTDSVEVKVIDGDTLTAGEDYVVAYDEENRELSLTFIDGEFVKGQELPENSVLEIRYDTKFALDANGHVIALDESIPNQATLTFNNGAGEDSKVSERPEVHTGVVGLYKYDEETGNSIEGAEFKIATSEENAQNGIFVKDANGNDLVAVSNENGVAVFEGLEFGEDAIDDDENATVSEITGADVYEYDWEDVQTIYYIVETAPAPGYSSLEDVIPALVKHGQYDLTDIESLLQVGNNQIPEPKIHKGVKDIQNQSSGYNKDDVHDWVINSTVPAGIANYTKYVITDTIDERLVFQGTDSVVVKVKDGDTLTAGTDYIVAYNEETRELSVKFIDGEFVKGKELAENSVIEIRFNTKFALDANGHVIALDESIPNQATITYNTGSGEKSKVSEKPEIHTGAVGVFKYVDLNKNGQHDEGEPALENAVFKIKNSSGEFVKDANGNDLSVTTDKDGKGVFEGLEFGEDALNKAEYKTVDSITGAEVYKYNWEKVETSYTIVETETPAGFNKITEEIPTTIKHGKFDMIDLSKYIKVGNTLMDKPEIHKGVKDIQNQSSGYNKDDIHDWVINSTVPAGIANYTKYVITDTIDERLVFQGTDSVVVKVKDGDTLTAGTDYIVAYNEETRELKLTFIDGEFVKGKELAENSVIEIRFNTKFALDVNGHVIALDESIPNQATLTFNNGAGEDSKVSERPEIHTGIVGLFKYDEKTGKSIEGAEFKIATSESNAQNRIFVKDASGNDLVAVSDERGVAVFEGLEFGEDALGKAEYRTTDLITGANVYKYDWSKVKTTYYIVETKAPEGYDKIEESIPADVQHGKYVLADIESLIPVANSKNVYDLALRKYITAVKDGATGVEKQVTDRIPNIKDEELQKLANGQTTTAEKVHTKEPVVVHTTDIVTYTIEIFNEGPNDAYASLVRDDIPSGLEFVPYTEGDGSINDIYRWKMMDAKGNEVSDIKDAAYLLTDYLGKDEDEANLIKAFDPDGMKLDSRKVQIQFKVTEPTTSNRILTNKADIAEEQDARGNTVSDRDSVAGVWNKGEDDQDVEHVRVLYFDLALRKWVTEAIVTENGKTQVYQTGHKAEDDPEDVVKVDLKKSKVNSVGVKFRYSIRITNQGEIPGEATEVRDDIPEGLKFMQEDNPDWRVEDGKIVTNKLATTTLQPGESAEVEIILTWENSTKNMGVMVNTAEINKDHNNYGTADIDSTPGNNVAGEDDIDDAPVMLSIKTGSQTIAIAAIGFAIVAILGSGIAVIKKTV